MLFALHLGRSSLHPLYAQNMAASVVVEVFAKSESLKRFSKPFDAPSDAKAHLASLRDAVGVVQKEVNAYLTELVGRSAQGWRRRLGGQRR
ncbi:hypothetical protein HPB50_020858 [Hyalomma asiaticum]|uniref:Uncharacterized protein n=1 Tax=Hyalomma asiaticum TaxID=266040 RepID=A0ACB7RQ52_HYAAI|nr:hypothetical protein HPB50_020858 [Hyalomma asiaticum]